MVSFSTTANFSGFYTAELSDANGLFASPVAIGSGPSSPISAVIPAGTNPGTGYRIRVTNSNPYLAGGDNGSDLAVNTCTTAGITVGSITGSPFCANTSYSVTITFTANGTFTGAYLVQLSDSTGNFASPLTIGYGYTSPLNVTIPAGTAPGVNYRIRVMNNNTSVASSGNNSSLKINTCTIGFEEHSLAAGLSIYPNPNNGEFYIEFKKEVSNVSVEIMNVLGQNVSMKQFNTIKEGTRNLFTLPGERGTIYILKIKCDEGEVVKRVTRY